MQALQARPAGQLREEDVTHVTGPTVVTDTLYEHMRAHVSGGRKRGGDPPATPGHAHPCPRLLAPPQPPPDT